MQFKKYHNTLEVHQLIKLTFNVNKTILLILFMVINWEFKNSFQLLHTGRNTHKNLQKSYWYNNFVHSYVCDKAIKLGEAANLVVQNYYRNYTLYVEIGENPHEASYIAVFPTSTSTNLDSITKYLISQFQKISGK